MTATEEFGVEAVFPGTLAAAKGAWWVVQRRVVAEMSR
jgi:hypothetical protein